jgi:hypothetical protein
MDSRDFVVPIKIKLGSCGFVYGYEPKVFSCPDQDKHLYSSTDNIGWSLLSPETKSWNCHICDRKFCDFVPFHQDFIRETEIPPLEEIPVQEKLCESSPVPQKRKSIEEPRWITKKKKNSFLGKKKTFH